MKSSSISAGLVMVRHNPEIEILLVHPGGPFFVNKDDGSWTIPKGLVDKDESIQMAAIREFQEETGVMVSTNNLISLGTIRQKSGKTVYAWAFLGSCDPNLVKSNLFEMEYPEGSGNIQWFPEIDRAEFFSAGIARQKIIPAQIPFIDRVINFINLL
jgi:predicted NUDIX family NTP pyrophosphohydrolase